MKRKLDANDVPMPLENSNEKSEEPKKEITQITTFNQFNLDARLLQSIAKEGFSKPTPVQAQGIPLALQGKDVLAHAKTGSGKTAAYLLPVLDSILRLKTTSPQSNAVSALILVPTRELADQVTKAISAFSAYCAREVRAINLTQKISDAVQRSLLAELPDIVVATPARVRLHISNNDLELSKLLYIILDEADLLFSYGYEEDLQHISQALPPSVQCIMASATLSKDVDSVKGLFCKNAVLLELQDAVGEGDDGVSQFVVKCGEEEKFLLIYVIFKLKLVKGKCIVFVADVDRSYRLKLYLEQFGIRSCVLNSELPVNSRIHVVEEFNKNVYDVIIASDELEVIGSEHLRKQAKGSEAAEEDGLDGRDDGKAPSKKQKPLKVAKKTKQDKEYGISRGIDFKNVACVLNFDLPLSATSYIHRIGRTGRAGRSGMALSFVVPTSEQGKHKPTSISSTANDEKILTTIIASQKKLGHEVQDYAFDERAVDAFRYRINDALRAVTGVAIREARSRELRQELINSEKLKRHFEENPEDLRHLRHDGELRPAKVQAHLKHVPEYLMPSGAGQRVGRDIGFVGFKKTTGENRIRKARERNRARGKGKPGKKDPLKTFRAKSRK